jgi:multidrug efflux pump subunit AcrA (membrane-fusion protein)
MIQVLSGLAAGERVVVAGQTYLAPGDRVRVAGAAKTGAGGEGLG